MVCVTPGGDHPKEWHPGSGEGLAGAEGAVSQRPGRWQPLLSPCPATRALSQPHMPFPALGEHQGGSGGTCPAQSHSASRTCDSQHRAGMRGLCCTALPGENGFFVPSRPSMSSQTQGRTTGPVLCVLERGPADRQGGDSSAAPSASLSGARHSTLGQHGCWEGCGTRGSPVVPGGSHTSLWHQPGGHSGPLCHCGVQGQRAGLPSSRQQGWQARASMEVIPWG